MTYLIAFINLLVLGCVAGSIYNRQPDNMKPLYRTALVVKLLAGFAVGWLYFYYYGEGDTITYWQDGKIVSDLIMDNPSGALRFFWNENADPELLPGLINLQQRSLFFAKISGILSLLTSGNYWLMSILISSVSFLGAWYIFRRVTDFFPSSDQAAALSFLFFPSVVFWSSGLIKESLGLASIFFLTAIFLNLCQYKKVKWGDGVLIILSLWIGWNLKYYWIGVFVPVILTTAIIIRLKHSFVFFQRFDGASWVVLFVIIFLTGTSIHPNFYPNRFLEVIVENNREFMLLTYPDNAVHYNDLSATFGSVLMNSPQALVAGFFRPFIWEGHHIISVAAGVENTVLLILFITSIISIKRFFSSPDRLMALAAIAYCVVLGIFLALSTPNFGTLSRYKIGFLPFLVFLTVYKNPFVNKMTGLAGR
ncbi:MAG: hypothetical protein HOP08_05180 [Cyclobacteriaceae bacterium]|nr:hypothetical protein [Cyclobacteriaceae bacterium]